MARKPLIAGNWKMNLNHLEAIALVQKIAFSLPAKYFDKVDVTVIPPFTDIRSVQTLIEGDKLLLTYGAQDVSAQDSGAFTGEISGSMLAKLGCTFVVVGHSRRRTLHGETNETVLAKTKAALKNGLTPIVCIGEGLEIREAGSMSPTTSTSSRVRWRAWARRRSPRSSSRTNLSGPSAPAVSLLPPMHRKCVLRYEQQWPNLPTPRSRPAFAFCTAVASAPRTSGRSSARPTSTALLSAARHSRLTMFATLSAIAAGGPLP